MIQIRNRNPTKQNEGKDKNDAGKKSEQNNKTGEGQRNEKPEDKDAGDKTDLNSRRSKRQTSVTQFLRQKSDSDAAEQNQAAGEQAQSSEGDLSKIDKDRAAQVLDSIEDAAGNI